MLEPNMLYETFRSFINIVMRLYYHDQYDQVWDRSERKFRFLLITGGNRFPLGFLSLKKETLKKKKSL